MVPDWIGWVFALFAAYRVGAISVWLLRGTARTFNFLRWKRVTTSRQSEPQKYWLLVACNVAVAIPVLVGIAWLLLAPSPHQTPNEALIAASGEGNLAAAMTALHAGADVNAMNDAGETPLNRAAAGCHLAVTRTLLALGARVNTKAHDIKYKTMDGWTALISAAGDRHPECVQIVQALISAGADVNAGPKYGPSTPLLMAATEENVEAAKLLLAAGADVNAGPATPLALATAQSQPATHDRAAMEALLRQHGGHA